MASYVKQESTKFVVDLGPVKLPSMLEKELEGEIQRIVLSALARVDYRGDLRIGGLPPGTYGYIFDDWPPSFPPGTFEPWPPKGGGGSIPVGLELGPRDHTTIMQAFMERPLPIVRPLIPVWRERGTPLTGEDVLESMVKLSLPPHIRKIAETALRIRRETASAKTSRAAGAALAAINKRIAGTGSVDDMLDALRSMERSGEYANVEGAEVGLRVATAILEDGRRTIYADDNPFYTDMDAMAKGATGIAEEDVKGAISGAVGGVAATAAGGPTVAVGAAAGAAAGAIGGSLAQAAVNFLDWLF